MMRLVLLFLTGVLLLPRLFAQKEIRPVVATAADEVVWGDGMRVELRCVSVEAEQILIRRIGDWARTARYSWAVVLDAGGTSPDREPRRYVSRSGMVEMYIFPGPAFQGVLNVQFRADAASGRTEAQSEFERFSADFAQEVSVQSGSP